MSSLTIYYIACVLQMTVFLIYMKELTELKHSIILTAVCWIAAQWLRGTVLTVSGQPVLSAIVSVAFVTGIVFWQCGGTWERKLLIAWGYLSGITALHWFLVSVVCAAGYCQLSDIEKNAFTAGLLLILTQIVALTVIQFAMCIWKQQVIYRNSPKNWLGVQCVSGGCLLAIIQSITAMIRDSSYRMSQLSVSFVLVGISVFSYYFYCISLENTRIDTESRVYRKQLSVYREWYERVLQTRTEIRALKHDTNNHFSVLQKLCIDRKEGESAEESLDQIKNYLNELGYKYNALEDNSDSGNMIIDSIVDLKRGTARSMGIELETDLFIPEKMPINNLDLVILLGNLLDNAIEACEKLTKRDGVSIRLGMRYVMKNLVLNVKNPYDGHLDGMSGNREQLLPTGKEEKTAHGIGLRNVRDIVEKYNGELEWSADGGVFSVDILLYGFADSKGESDETKDK